MFKSKQQNCRLRKDHHYGQGHFLFMQFKALDTPVVDKYKRKTSDIKKNVEAKYFTECKTSFCLRKRNTSIDKTKTIATCLQ